MANTHSNLTGDIRRIHATFPVAETAEGLSLSLSSQESSLAQVDLANITVRRSLGRKVMLLDVIDRSGFAELSGEETPTRRLKIPLGHTAIIGRDRLGLPLLKSEIVSEEHLTLGYVRTTTGDSLTIHDNNSTNGSHLIGETEQTWQERTFEISNDTDAEYHDPVVPTGEAWDWLHDPTNTQALRRFV